MNMSFITVRFFSQLIPALCLMTSVGIHSPVAADEVEERIFKIEVIVFERTVKSDDSDVENWPKNLVLSYPENSIKLNHPDEIYPLTSKVGNNTNNPNMSLSSEFLQALAPTNPSDDEFVVVNQESSAEKEIGSPSVAAMQGKTNFLEYLEDSKKDLKEQQKALNRTRGFRTIFHEAWIQSLEDRDKAPALMIRGGNQFGDHFELEGSIKLSVSRYLHIDTDLWLTTFVPDYGQPQEHWPKLPSQEKQYVWTEYADPEEQPLPNSNFKPVLDLTMQTQPKGGINTHYRASHLSKTQSGSQIASPYAIKEIVTLRQKRKMRSTELHYIDHPRMGLLVVITPFELERKHK